MTDPLFRPPSEPLVVAIDGPAGSGKSSVAKEVARRLGYGYLDTGAVYRALAWHTLDHDADTSDAAAVIDALGDFDLSISLDPDAFWVRVGEHDVTGEIRGQRVTDAVSGVARIPIVRHAATTLFRQLVAGCGRRGVVVEGRDITTVVAPDAPVRILLTASEEVRAARRHGQENSRDRAAVAASLQRRDASDAAVAEFLTAAEGVDVVDSTELDFPGTVDAVLAVAAKGLSHGR